METTLGTNMLRSVINRAEFELGGKKTETDMDRISGKPTARQIVAEKQLLTELMQITLEAPGQTTCRLENNLLRIKHPMPELKRTLDDLSGPVLGIEGEVATLKQLFPSFLRTEKTKNDRKTATLTHEVPGIDLIVSKNPDANGNYTLTFQNIKQIFRPGEAPLKYNNFTLALRAEAGELTTPLAITTPKNQDLKIENVPQALKDKIAEAFYKAPVASVPVDRIAMR